MVGVCCQGVRVNSILCSGYKHWVHARCSGVTVQLSADHELVCPRCSGLACPIDGHPVTEVVVVIWWTHFATWAIFCHMAVAA